MIYPKKLFYLLIIISAAFACTPDPGEENSGNQEPESLPAEEQPTRMEQSLTPVRGVFHDLSKNCKEGFGLCDVEILPENVEESPVLDSLQVQEGERLINATFRLDTKDQSSMIIEFLEGVPYWEDQFVVAEAVTPFTGLFGYSQVQVQSGAYKADKSFGQYGGVSVKVTAIK